MDEYLIKQISTDLSNEFSAKNYTEKMIKDAINLIRNGYSNEHEYLNEDQLLSILCHTLPTANEYTFHSQRLAKSLYDLQDPAGDFAHASFNDKQKYYTVLSVVANQLNDTSLINRIKRVGNQFVYISTKMNPQKF